jgi:hypothetical protein
MGRRKGRVSDRGTTVDFAKLGTLKFKGWKMEGV